MPESPPGTTFPIWPAVTGLTAASRSGFVAQQPFLARQPVVVAAEAAVAAQRAMARDYRRDQVGRAGGAGGAGRPRYARAGGEDGVADRGAGGDRAQLRPQPLPQ